MTPDMPAAQPDHRGPAQNASVRKADPDRDDPVAAGFRVIPVVTLADAAQAVPVATALAAGGLPVAEVTFRTAAADAALAALAQVPGMLVGAGSVLNVAHVERALNAGARFVVSPGVSVDVIRRCATAGVPVFPGVATATDLMLALEEGVRVVKFYPAELLGGLAMLDALAAPFPDVRFVPTGGLSAASIAGYLAHPRVAAVGGTWIVSSTLLARQAFDDITRLAAEAVHAANAATTSASASTAPASTASAKSPSAKSPSAKTASAKE